MVYVVLGGREVRLGSCYGYFVSFLGRQPDVRMIVDMRFGGVLRFVVVIHDSTTVDTTQCAFVSTFIMVKTIVRVLRTHPTTAVTITSDFSQLKNRYVSV